MLTRHTYLINALQHGMRLSKIIIKRPYVVVRFIAAKQSRRPLCGTLLRISMHRYLILDVDGLHPIYAINVQELSRTSCRWRFTEQARPLCGTSCDALCIRQLRT
jgi:hypothetical protein